MQLAVLRAALALPPVDADRGIEVTSIAYDSRTVTPGALFVAIPGFHVDGHDYLEAAVAAGAVALVVRAGRRAALPDTVPLLAVPDTRGALSVLAAHFYGYPGRALRVIGVTGTDGKTTTTYLISALLEAAGHVTGLIGTVQYKVGPAWRENTSRQTTPEALELQQLLAEMREAGVTHAVVESSSHGLALHKLDHAAYDIAVVTNVGADHLELHGTPERYLEAKGRLFALLDESAEKPGHRAGVVNADDHSAAHMRRRTHASVLAYGIEQPADVYPQDLRLDDAGSSFELVTPRGRVAVRTRLPGRYNVSNALAAATVAHLEGVSLPQIANAFRGAGGVPGRMERIEAGQPFSVIVDYAHTGPAFEKVLTSLRGVTDGRIIAVFGCAGGRSPERREGMGRAAARHADFSVLTNEDPYEEDPHAILREIAAVLEGEGRRAGEEFTAIEDRRDAIRTAFQKARAGDLVLLAGKGHEQSIILGHEKLAWDDRRVAREELERLGFRAAEVR